MAATKPDLPSVVQGAVSQFSQISGLAPEQVSGVRTTDDGWSVLVEVVDVERVPPTTSVLSTYRIDVDGAARLTGYERLRRYTRSSTGAN